MRALQHKDAYAERLPTEVHETERRVLGPDHPDSLVTLNHLAKAYAEQGKYELPEPLFTSLVEAHRRVMGEEYPGTLIVTPSRHGRLPYTEIDAHRRTDWKPSPSAERTSSGSHEYFSTAGLGSLSDNLPRK